MSSLRKKMIEDLRVRNYSPRTIDTYVRCVASFARHFGKSPDKLGPEHIRDYQLFLVESKHASWSLFNQTVCALRFFYKVSLGRKWVIGHIPFPRQEKRLPVIPSVRELKALFNAVGNVKHRTVLMTMYAAGLRISEAMNLQISDIDSDRRLVRIRQGKGKRDRYVPLSSTLLNILREYWKAYRPESWLFPGISPDQPLSVSSVQKVCSIAQRKARLSKRVTTHTIVVTRRYPTTPVAIAIAPSARQEPGQSGLRQGRRSSLVCLISTWCLRSRRASARWPFRTSS